MPRGLVYSGRTQADGAPAPERVQPAAPQPDADGYKEKLVKYVPAEVIAFFTPITAFIGAGEDGLLIVALVAGVVGTVAYIYRQNQKIPAEKQAPVWSYLLAIWAFLAWGLATSPVTADVLGLSLKGAGIILGISAFLVPALDFWTAEKEAAE